MSLTVSDGFLKKLEGGKSDEAPLYSDAGLDDCFRDLVDDYAEVQALIKELEAKKDAIAQDLATLMEASEVRACYAAGQKIMLQASSRETLDKLSLIEHGVAKAVIEACTRRTPFVCLRVSRAKPLQQ
jgi:hypothetical protein